MRKDGHEKIELKKIPRWQIIVPRILQSIAWYPGYFLLKIFLKMKIQGHEQVKKALQIAKQERRGILIVSNHVSELDPILTLTKISPTSYAFPLFWVARPGREYKDPDFSWRKYIYGDLFFLAWGAQPAVRGYKDYAKSLARHAYLLKEGYSVCIFPEGAFDPKKKKVRGGAGYLLHNFNPVIILLKIDGLQNITNKTFFGRKHNLLLKFSLLDDEQIKTIKNSLDDHDPVKFYKSITEKIMKIIYDRM